MTTHPPRMFTSLDAAFIALLLTLLGTVWYLGYGSYQEITKVEKVRATAGKFVKWVEAAQAQRSAGAAVAPTACGREDPTASTERLNWANCLRALQGPGQAMHGVQNPLHATAPVFSSKCDRNVLNTMGSIVVEKGVSGLNGNAQVIAYGPIGEHEPIHDELLLRVTVCGHGFTTSGVAEVKF